MTNIIPFVSIRINFKREEMERITFLMKHNSEPTIHSLVRFLIADKYQKTKETQLKYGASIPRETYADKIQTIKAMDDKEVTEYFYSLGIFKDTSMQGAPDIKISYKIANDPEKPEERVELVKYTNINLQFPPYENVGRTLDEIINLVVKQKLI